MNMEQRNAKDVIMPPIATTILGPYLLINALTIGPKRSQWCYGIRETGVLVTVNMNNYSDQTSKCSRNQF